MVKNGQRISMLYSGAKTYPQSAQTLRFILNKGDRIWMQNFYNYTVTIHDWTGYNVFSGILMKILNYWNKEEETGFYFLTVLVYITICLLKHKRTLKNQCVLKVHVPSKKKNPKGFPSYKIPWEWLYQVQKQIRC